MQALELEALDQLFRWRPVEAVDDRIVLVTIDDQDLQQIGDWPIPDQVLARVLTAISAQQPRAIGLDLYRNLPVGQNRQELQQVFSQTPNLIGIEKLEDPNTLGVPPPQVLDAKNQVGFNNVLADSDGRVRRSLLFWRSQGQLRQSLALKLSLMYLKPLGIEAEGAPHDSTTLKLGTAVFSKLRSQDGGYVRVDTAAYQILANPRSSAARFRTISLTQLLHNQFDRTLLKDRIVLVGSTAASLKDFFYTAYSNNRDGAAQPVAGVELQAQFISQILSAVLDKRSLLQSLPEPLEWLWILVWSGVGAVVAWQIRRPSCAFLCMVAAGGTLFGAAYLSFLGGWWIPLVPPMLTLIGSAVGITGYNAYQEGELKKSKEFLNSVIDAISAPVFVKDQKHRWVVLNDAYCRLIGEPHEHLLERSELDVLPSQQAQRFREQDERTFQTGLANETEETLTTPDGKTYLISTKRSLHKDSAGNVFLVGIIHDITQHKQKQEELRRRADELVRFNAELQQTGDRLRQLAYHDSLTGLPNRQLFCERLEQAIAWAGDRDQMVAVLFLDLDGFKQINDTYGHEMGNLMLKAVASRLSGSLRGSDTIARLGGDEFVVVLPGIPSLQDVIRVAEKLVESLSRNFVLEGQSIPISTSIGISMYPLDELDSDLLLKKADMAMYEAKRLGKNRYEFAQKIGK